MGDESINLERSRFDLWDLGLLDGETEREYKIVTRNAGAALKGSAAVFCLRDDAKSAVFLRSTYLACESRDLHSMFAQARSLFARLLETSQSVSISDLSDHPDFDDAFSSAIPLFKSVLSEPVYGPAREPIGALIVLSSLPREWTALDRMELKDHAHLLSRHVLLRASLETLKRLSREREAISRVERFRN